MTGVWHHAFGTYIIRAPFELPSLPRTAEVQGDPSLIRLEWADAGVPGDIEWQHHWIDRGETQLSLGRQEETYILRVPDGADFLLDASTRTVRISPAADALDASTLEHILVDQILPRLLAHLGGTLIHAGAVRIGVRQVLFLGESGWGKSTLSALLHRAGYRVLSDDCVQLFHDGDGSVRVIPTYPSLRLKPDSLQSLFPNGATTLPFAGHSGKRRLPLAAAADDPYHPDIVDALYLLGHPNLANEEIHITPVSATQSCLALIRHSFRLDLSDRHGSALHLQRCGRIASVTPGFQLHHPHDHNRNAALLQILLSHVENLPAISKVKGEKDHSS